MDFLTVADELNLLKTESLEYKSWQIVHYWSKIFHLTSVTLSMIVKAWLRLSHASEDVEGRFSISGRRVEGIEVNYRNEV